ncbi:complement C1s subcomponent-like [Conger conger]|uniref:complement C1s subcomponent-like n=1 Tax=Conger conger TaxID=82655 RepID=UPI002A5A4AFA|nr:complement C1s subcomponent-like [Conger conger]
MIRLLVFFLPLSTSLPLLGWVESPGYPRGYPNEATLNWKRCAPSGHALVLTLTHLDLEDSEECQQDAVEISSDETKLASLCGRKSYEELQSSVNPSLQSSNSGCLMLSFRSDYSNTERHSGFRGFYTVQDVDECEDPDNNCNQLCSNYIGGYRCFCWPGYYLDNDEHTCTVNCSRDLSGSYTGTVSSPGRPGPYPDFALCSYKLAVEDELQLVLEFAPDFDVEEAEDGKCTDSLKIKTPSREFGPYCGNVPPVSPFRTGSHQVEVRFLSGGSGTNTGFTLSYKTTAKTCPNEVTPHSTMDPRKLEYHRGDRVTVSCDTGYFPYSDDVVNDITKDLNYKSVCLSSGIWTPAYSCTPVDCSTPDIPEDGPLQVLTPKQGTKYLAEVQFQCESKYYKLEPNEPYICDEQGNWRSRSGQTTLPKCVTVCGKTEKQIVSYSRIFGGKPAESGQIPWQLWLYSLDGGASLINDQWALTAAHVVENNEGREIGIYGGLIIRKGAFGIEERGVKHETAISNNPGLVVLESEKFIIHPAYRKGESKEQRLSYDNDIALVKLKSRVKLGPTLLPVCLPEKKGESMENKLGTVSGWGKTEKSTDSKNKHLLHVDIQGYSQNQCENVPIHPDLKKKMAYTRNMFCAGADGADSCQGDSGGPFVVPALGADNGPYYLYGIVSWGPQCKDKGYYTKVENYVDWIKETMEKEERASEQDEA